MPPLGPHLRQVDRPALDVLASRGKRQEQRRRLEPAAPLVRVAITRLLEDRPRVLEIVPVRFGQKVKIEEDDRLVARVVHPADEASLFRHAKASRGQTLSNSRIAKHLGKRRASGPPRAPPQAPQSWADSWGLFRLVDPWPMNSTRREKPEVRPISRSTFSAMSAISSIVKPC